MPAMRKIGQRRSRKSGAARSQARLVCGASFLLASPTAKWPMNMRHHKPTGLTTGRPPHSFSGSMDDGLTSTSRALEALAGHVRARTPRVRVLGCEPSFAACAVARVAEALPDEARPLVVAVPDEPTAIVLARDIGFYLGGAPHADDPSAAPRVLHLPAVETSPYAELSPDRRAILRRLATLFRLSQGFAGQVLVASAPALLRRVIPRDELGKLSDLLIPEQELDRDKLVAFLARAGYGRAQVVEDPGTFALRGGVIDIFAPLYRYPARIELF